MPNLEWKIQYKKCLIDGLVDVTGVAIIPSKVNAKIKYHADAKCRKHGGVCSPETCNEIRNKKDA